MSDDFIGVYENALSREACQQIIARFEQSKMARPGATGEGVDVAKKDSLDIVLDDAPGFQDVMEAAKVTTLRYLLDYVRTYRFLVTGALSLTLAHPKTGKPTELRPDTFDELCNETMLMNVVRAIYRSGKVNMQKYAAGRGGYHHFHSEIYPKDANCEQLHRVLLWMFYLNDVAEGGETEFFYQKRSIAPRAGTLVIAPAGFTHTHKGHVPRSGDKYILTSWVLYQRAETIFRAR